jgi:uncharacterized protein YcbX
VEIGEVINLWRYPIKSLKAEPLAHVAVLADGLEGDRTASLLIESPMHARAGKPFRGKESPLLHLTSDPEIAASYAADAGALVTLTREPARWFDKAPVSMLFDLWVGDVEALVGEALDPLRWRPNIYVRAATGFTLREDDLLDRTLRCGGVELLVVATNKRCVTTTYDIATGDRDPDVLGVVARERANVVGIYCEVVVPGELAVGDALLID